jgi:hypothetical protein
MPWEPTGAAYQHYFPNNSDLLTTRPYPKATRHKIHEMMAATDEIF